MHLPFALLCTQALLGAVDNLWHHEITERLPTKKSAAGELRLHAAREFVYALLFIALALYEWRGLFSLIIGALMALEVLITLIDFVVEDRTRRLPPFERVLHTVLALNFGAVLVSIAPLLFAWWQLPSAIVLHSQGPSAWLFCLFGLGALLFAARNGLAVLHLTRPAEWVRDPISRPAQSSGRSVLISGATGFIGRHLVRRLIGRGDAVIVWTRDAGKALDRFGPHVRIVTDLDALPAEESIDAIVNLAGASILARPWTAARRRKLIASRVEPTRRLVALIGRLARPPRVLVSASAIGYYGIHADEDLDEHCGPSPIFQSRLCQEWEAAAVPAEDCGARVVRLRLGMVLGRDGGALASMSRPHRFALGAVLGSGVPWVSWIHIEDLINMLVFALDKPSVRGVFNGVSPLPVRQADLQRAIARELNRPLWLKVPGRLIRFLLGERAQLLLDGQRVLPNRPVAMGFMYRYHNLSKALRDLLGEESALRAAGEVYFNGACPVCRAEMSHYAAICADLQPELRFVDATRHADDLAHCGLRAEHLQRRVYLTNRRGQIISGFPAVLALWRLMPRYRGLSRLFGAPLIKPAAELLYDHLIAPLLTRWATRRMQRADVDRYRRELV